MNRKKIIARALLVVTLTAILGGCQSKTVPTGTAGTATSTADGAVKKAKKIVVGTGSTYKNVCFLDEKNNLTGFEVEALKKIDQVLPQYEFEFRILDFGAILTSLETSKIDLAAHQFEGNEDRRSKYLFAEEGVTRYDLRLVVKESRSDIKSLEDIGALGGTVQVGSASSNNTYIVEKWNREHGNKFKTVLSPSDTTITLQNLDTGKIDAFVSIDRNVEDYKKTYNAKIKVVGTPLNYSNSYYLYQKNNAEAEPLKKDVDEAIRKLKDDGTLKKLSEQWLGADYIPEKGK